MSYLGFSGFAMMHRKFPTQAFLDVFKGVKQPCTALLYTSFGKKKRTLKKWLELVKLRDSVLEIHFSNEAGRRNNNLQRGEFLRRLSVGKYNYKLEHKNKRLLKKIRKRTRKLKKLIDKVMPCESKTRVIISTGLESQFTHKAHKVLVSTIKKEWPGVLLVHNPVNDASVFYGADLKEVHGIGDSYSNAKQTIINMDGISVLAEPGERYAYQYEIDETKKEFEKELKKSPYAIMLWTASSQGLQNVDFGGRGDWLPPRKRGRKLKLSPLAAVKLNKLLRELQT